MWICLCLCSFFACRFRWFKRNFIEQNSKPKRNIQFFSENGKIYKHYTYTLRQTDTLTQHTHTQTHTKILLFLRERKNQITHPRTKRKQTIHARWRARTLSKCDLNSDMYKIRKLLCWTLLLCGRIHTYIETHTHTHTQSHAHRRQSLTRTNAVNRWRIGCLANIARRCVNTAAFLYFSYFFFSFLSFFLSFFYVGQKLRFFFFKKPK